MDLLRPPVYNETPNNNSTNTATNDFKQQAQNIRDLASAMKQLEQAAKSADRAVSSLSKRTYNTRITSASGTDYSTGGSTGSTGSNKQTQNWHQQYLSNKGKIKEFKQIRKEAAYGTERKLDNQAIKTLKKKNRSTLRENVFHPLAGALLKGGAVLVGVFKLIGDKINKTVDTFTKQFNNTTFSTNTIYKETNKIAAENRMGDIYDRVAELNKLENGLASNITNDIKNGISKLKALGSTSDEVNNSLTKLNATVLKVDQNMSNIIGIQKGVDINTSTKYGQGIQGILLDYFYDLWYEELPNKYGKKGKNRTKGIQDVENQTYIIQHEDYSPTAKAGIQAVYNGGNFANLTTEGWEGWNVAQGVYVPGVDYSEAAKSDMRYNYIKAQADAYSIGGLEGQQALVEESIKQTRILQHLSGSLASFDEVEQVSAFSQADTAEEAKKEVKESQLTNEKLEEQIELWGKQYNLTDKEKQILMDLYNQGFSLTDLTTLLESKVDLEDFYTKIKPLIEEGVTADEIMEAFKTGLSMNISVEGIPDSIALILDEKSLQQQSDMQDQVWAETEQNEMLKFLADLIKSVGIAPYSDTAIGGAGYLDTLTDMGVLDAETASKLKQLEFTPEKYREFLMNRLNNGLGFSFVNGELDKLVNKTMASPTYNPFMDNDYLAWRMLNGGMTTTAEEDEEIRRLKEANDRLEGTYGATGGIINERLSNITVGEQGREALIPLDSQYGRDYLSSVMSDVLSTNESSNVDNSDTFIFNMNGSLYASDKRIPEEFALQMYNAIENIRKKKGVK